MARTHEREAAAGRRGRCEFVNYWVGTQPGVCVDVGCGDGHFTEWFASRCDLCVGVDVNEAAARGGAAARPHVRFVVASGDRLPLGAETVNVAVLSEVLEHVPTDLARSFIDEAHRVLARGGLLVLTVPHAGAFAWLDPLDVKRRVPWLYSAYCRIAKYSPETPSAIGHRHFSRRNIDDLLDGRFESLADVYGGLLLEPMAIWVRIVLDRLRLLRPWSRNLLLAMSGFDDRFSYGRWSYTRKLALRKL